MTGAVTWGLIALGAVIGWCARAGLGLWQAARRTGGTATAHWARSRRAHRQARAKLRARQAGHGGIQLWT